MIGAGGVLNDEAYAYSMGRIRSMETRLLGRARFDRLIEADSTAEAFRQLTDAGYADSDNPESTNLDRLIALDAFATYSTLREMVPVPVAVDLLAIRFDIDDAQRSLRSDLEPAWRLGPVAEAVPDPATPGELPSPIAEFQQMLGLALTGRLPLNVADAKISHGGFSLMRRLSQSSGSQLLVDLTDLFADVANISILLRGRAIGRSMVEVREHLVPGGLSGEILVRIAAARLEDAVQPLRGTRYETAARLGLTAFLEERRLDLLERELDNLIMTAARQGRFVAMGPEVVVGYLIGKEFEWKNLRLIFLGRDVGMRPDQIRQRLRDIYV